MAEPSLPDGDPLLVLERRKAVPYMVRNWWPRERIETFAARYGLRASDPASVARGFPVLIPVWTGCDFLVSTAIRDEADSMPKP